MNRAHPLVVAALAALVACACGTASASVVIFSGRPATSWTDGTFSHHLSPDFPDGFYQTADPYAAYNGFGQDGESIRFTTPVFVQTLEISECADCEAAPDTYTVSLYDHTGHLLTSQTVAPTMTPLLLSFDTADASAITFTFLGGKDYYGDGRSNTAWYTVSDVTYRTTPVAEPATPMLWVAGLGAIALAARRRSIRCNRRS